MEGMSVEQLELYIRWYEEDVIPGFERQAAKTRYDDGAFYDAIRRSQGHLERLRKEKAAKEAEIEALQQGDGSQVPETT